MHKVGLHAEGMRQNLIKHQMNHALNKNKQAVRTAQ